MLERLILALWGKSGRVFLSIMEDGARTLLIPSTQFLVTCRDPPCVSYLSQPHPYLLQVPRPPLMELSAGEQVLKHEPVRVVLDSDYNHFTHFSLHLMALRKGSSFSSCVALFSYAKWKVMGLL